MKTYKEPFPHEDGAPASWQDNRDAEAIDKSIKQSRQAVQEYSKMILASMK